MIPRGVKNNEFFKLEIFESQNLNKFSNLNIFITSTIFNIFDKERTIELTFFKFFLKKNNSSINSKEDSTSNPEIIVLISIIKII